jgi:hypothetical protein
MTEKKVLTKKQKLFFLLGLIFLLGVFLRAYHFQEWLFFWSDQVRDADIAQEVVEGKTAWPLLGPVMHHTAFKLGAMYHYFQISAMKIFGTEPYVAAYPDLFFSILSIPLLFVFLKIYFENKIALILTSLYAVSYYSIYYSRFAWNTNSLPFFVLLYFVALHRFLCEREKTSWLWVILLGISIGVGMQLHALLLVMALAITFFVFLFVLKKNWRTWKKWVVVLLVVLVLNSGQIFSEWGNGFSNSKALFETSSGRTDGGIRKQFENALANIDCHIQSNAQIITSIGDDDRCHLVYSDFIKKISTAGYTKKMMHDFGSDNLLDLARNLFLLLFSLSGYAWLIRSWRCEKELSRKYFLSLIIVYASLYFLLMLPMGGASLPRYFLHVFFMPFLFLGFWLKFLDKKYPQKQLNLFFVFSLFALVNFFTIFQVARDLSVGAGSKIRYPILGEMEQMLDYMISQADTKKELYVSGKSSYAFTFFTPLRYLSERRGFKLQEAEDYDNIPNEKSVFYFRDSPKKNATAPKSARGFEVENFKIFGDISVSKLKLKD